MLLFPYLGALQGFALPFNFLPSGVNSMISFWAYSLFYVFTEMWAVITIDGLFKGLQTALFTKDRVKKLTPSFGIWSNLGLIAAGAALSGIFSVASFTLYTQMMMIVSLFALSGLIAISLHLYGVKSSNFKFGDDTKNILSKKKETKKDITIDATLDAAIAETSKTLANIQKTAALTLNDGWSKDTGLISTKELDTLIEEDKEIKEYTKTEKNYVKKAFNAAGGFVSKIGGIASHWDLRDLAVVILAYNICLVLFEIVWKNQVKIYTSSGTSTVSYVQFMGNFNFWTGIISITLALLGPVIDKLPPEVRSLITPLLLGALSTIFFGLVLAPTTMATICPFLFSSSVSNLYWQIALIGTIQNVIVKASKYSVFEPVNSTSWSAKPKFVKDSYQDIVNQISGKWGKGLGSLIILGLLFYGGTLTNITVYIPIVLGLVIATWCYSAYNVATTLPNSLSGDSMVTVSTTSDEFKTKMNEIRAQCTDLKDLKAQEELGIRENNGENTSSHKQ
jgi:ATP/ADP translocase